MTPEDLIKEAYAYGVSVALQEAGIDKTAADETGTALASEPVGGERVKVALLGDSTEEVH